MQTAAILKPKFGGRIHWGQRKDVPNSLRQQSYCDVSKIEVPFTFEGEITTEVIEAIKSAIRNKSTGSGVYSTTYSCDDINFSKGIIVVSSSFYIGD